MRVVIGADHRGYAVREAVVALLKRLGHEVDDRGTHDTQIVLYPDVAADVARLVSNGEAERGILIGRTGLGMCIVANKFPGIRAAACHDEIMAETSRRYIDTNVLCLSAELLGELQIARTIEVWLKTPFEAGRHVLRLDRIAAVEQEIASRHQDKSEPRQ